MKECLLALSTEKVDATVEILGVVNYNINHFGFTNIKIAAPTEYQNIDLSMAFKKENVILFNIVSKILTNIKISDQNKIRQKWIAVTYDHKNDYTKLLRYLIIGLAIALMILLLMFLWNKSLRKYIKEKDEAEKKLINSITQISKQNEERKFLLQEIHHRVKNNLQIVSSLLKLQVENDKNNNEKFNVEKTIERIKAIGLIHEKIYQSPTLDKTFVKDYLESLVKSIISNYSLINIINTKLEIDAVFIKIENMVPFAIIINELVINSIKHGFNNSNDGLINISLKATASNYEFIYADNGVWINAEVKENFGTSLIQIFTQQLNDKFSLNNKSGTVYTFYFPLSLFKLI